MTNPIVGPAADIGREGQNHVRPDVVSTPAGHAVLVLTDEFEVARVVHSRPALNADYRQGQAIHGSCR